MKIKKVVASYKINKAIRESTKLSFNDNSVDVVYTSHLIEHLYQEDFEKILSESYRVLKRDGWMRIVLPDLEKRVQWYNENKDADAFMKSLAMLNEKIEQRGKTLFEEWWLAIGNINGCMTVNQQKNL